MRKLDNIVLEAIGLVLHISEILIEVFPLFMSNLYFYQYVSIGVTNNHRLSLAG